MEAGQQIIRTSRRAHNLKKGAKVALIVLLLFVIVQLGEVFQTRYQLVSPLIPQALSWEISKQFIFTALVATVANIVGLILYFFEKYLLVIILVALTLTVSRYIYM